MKTRLAVLLATLLVLVSCGDNGDDHTELLVSAAASLTDVFAEVEAAFEETNTGIDVILNLGGSSSLREQVFEGAPVDVFASADTRTMDQLLEAGEADDAVIFTRNSLQVAVPRDNPAGITSLGDFERDALLIGLCAEDVPCGSLAREALARAGVTPSIDTNEPDVRALLTKIEAGELDAGITYVTDVISTNGAVEGIDIPESDNVAADYPIAVLTGAPNQDWAEAFVEFVLSDAGQAILARYGFAAP